MVGMARRAVPARVVAGGTNVGATLAFKGVAPLHAARTSQRDVPTTLNRYSFSAHLLRPVGQAAPLDDVGDAGFARYAKKTADQIRLGNAGDTVRRQIYIPDRQPRDLYAETVRVVVRQALGFVENLFRAPQEILGQIRCGWRIEDVGVDVLTSHRLVEDFELIHNLSASA